MAIYSNKFWLTVIKTIIQFDRINFNSDSKDSNLRMAERVTASPVQYNLPRATGYAMRG